MSRTSLIYKGELFLIEDTAFDILNDLGLKSTIRFLSLKSKSILENIIESVLPYNFNKSTDNSDWILPIL